jgi:outer membrane protein assembly factor BamA
VRYDRRHKYLLGGALSDTNLRGEGEVLDLQAIVLYIQRARATWTKPWLFGIDPLQLRVDALWEQAPFVYRAFDYDQWWATLDGRYDLPGPLFFELGGGYESFHQRDDYEWNELYADDGAAGVQTYAASRRDTWLLRGSVGLDTRDNPFYPGRGFFARYGLDYRFGGDIDDQTGQEADLRAFLPLPGPPILALRAYGKRVDSVSFTEHLIRWGGPETVRGARYAGREGDTAYLATAELRWPLFMMPVSVTGEQVGFGLHAFTDVGDAFLDDRHDTNPRALFSFGAGAHINLLTWQLRFEAAKERDRDWVFEFMDVFNF